MSFTVTQTLISRHCAQALVDAALSQAQTGQIAICAAVVDATGRLKAYMAMDGAPMVAEKMAQEKARAALLGLSSGQLGEAMESSPAGMLSMGLQDSINFLAGGQPIFIEGEIVGAIGIGGSTPEQDDVCALAALASIFNKTAD